MGHPSCGIVADDDSRKDVAGFVWGLGRRLTLVNLEIFSDSLTYHVKKFDKIVLLMNS